MTRPKRQCYTRQRSRKRETKRKPKCKTKYWYEPVIADSVLSFLEARDLWSWCITSKTILHEKLDYVTLSVRQALFLNFALNSSDYINIIKLLVQKGVDIREDNDFALMLASTQGFSNIVEFLVKKGADVQADDNTALGLASERGHIETVRVLLRLGANPNAGAALIQAIRGEHMEIVHALVGAGALPNANHLLCATENGYTDLVDLFLRCGAMDTFGNALNIASKKGNIEIVKLLLAQGSIGLGRALVQASKNGHADIVKLLLSKGKYRIDDALLRASSFGHMEIVRLLVENGANLEENDHVAIRHAFINGHKDVVDFLLQHCDNVSKEFRMLVT